jgi:hypothetical protein
MINSTFRLGFKQEPMFSKIFIWQRRRAGKSKSEAKLTENAIIIKWKMITRSKVFVYFGTRSKVGGLDSRDQSRSRTSIVSWLTFENRRDYPSCQDQLFYLGRVIKIFVEICRDAVEICQEISTLSRPFESENDEKYRRIEKSWQENTKIHALIDRDRDKLSRNAKVFISRQISQSWSRLFWDISIVKTYFLTLSRFSQLSRLTLWRRRDRESRSRPRRDKLRPPRLTRSNLFFGTRLKVFIVFVTRSKF